MTALDEDWLLEHARERQTAAANHHTRGGDRCHGCAHRWHGTRCSTAGCNCWTSWRDGSADPAEWYERAHLDHP